MWSMSWLGYIRNDLQDIGDLDSGLARNVAEKVEQIEFALLTAELSLSQLA